MMILWRQWGMMIFDKPPGAIKYYEEMGWEH